jgi:hypothetical protein
METAFLIDGFNFYHSISNLDRRVRWFDFINYCKYFFPKIISPKIMYFTALAFWRGNETIQRHQIFIEANRYLGI